MSRINILPNIFIDYEGGKINLHEYINVIKNPKFYGGDLEDTISI